MLNVYVKMWGDLEQAKACIESLPPDATVYVVDGRYADFAGSPNRTPGAEEWCADQPNVEYHTPPDDRLPWGHENYEDEPHLRWPIHEQAKFANYEVLPQDEWVLHMDTDERIEHLDRSLLDELDSRTKYAPEIDSLAERGLTVPRLYQPRHWTFWIAGVMYPREYWSRETPARRLMELHLNSMSHQYINREAGDRIRIHNVGDDRPPEYHRRRADQLRTMGRHGRADQYAEKIRERLSPRG